MAKSLVGTEKVEDYVFQLDQYIVHLIDTPGFDDTDKSDSETLAEVAIWLANSYRSQIRLTGILYLHRITDNRLGGCAMKNLKMFKKMCGQCYLLDDFLGILHGAFVGPRNARKAVDDKR